MEATVRDWQLDIDSLSEVRLGDPRCTPNPNLYRSWTWVIHIRPAILLKPGSIRSDDQIEPER